MKHTELRRAQAYFNFCICFFFFLIYILFIFSALSLWVFFLLFCAVSVFRPVLVQKTELLPEVQDKLTIMDIYKEFLLRKDIGDALG